jgi:hypothetical protein
MSEFYRRLTAEVLTALGKPSFDSTIFLRYRRRLIMTPCVRWRTAAGSLFLRSLWLCG